MTRMSLAVAVVSGWLCSFASAATPEVALQVAKMAPDTRIPAVARYQMKNSEQAVFLIEGWRYTLTVSGTLSHNNPHPGELIIGARRDGTSGRASLQVFRDRDLDGMVNQGDQVGYDRATAVLRNYAQKFVPK